VNGDLFRGTDGVAPRPAWWLTAQMDDTKGTGEIDITVDTELVDVDGDGLVDVAREVTTTVVDVDGDGVPDIIEQTTTTAYDIDGDGV